MSDINAHYANDKFAPITDQELNKTMSFEYFKFYIVRDPFERLISCYIDKFEKGSINNYLFRLYGAPIMNFTKTIGMQRT
jgi:hypothetical protein